MTRRFMLIAGAGVCILTGAALVTASADAAPTAPDHLALLSDDGGAVFDPAAQEQEKEKKKPGDFKKGKGGFPDFKKMMGKGGKGGSDFKKKMMSYKGKMGGKGFPDFKKKGKGGPDFKKKKKDDDAVGEVSYPSLHACRDRQVFFMPARHQKA
jgi:hypothetical protein